MRLILMAACVLGLTALGAVASWVARGASSAAADRPAEAASPRTADQPTATEVPPIAAPPRWRVEVVRIERLQQVKEDRGRGTVETYLATGVFLAVQFEATNLTKDPISAKDVFNAFDLIDAAGRRFVRNVDATLGYMEMRGFPSGTDTVNPGLRAAVWLVCDVPADAAGFALVAGDERLAEVPASRSHDRSPRR